jgi:hypothetical protein
MAMVVALGCGLVACSEQDVIGLVESGVSAAQVALPVIVGATDLTPAQKATLLGDLQGAVNGLNGVAQAIETGGSAQTVAAAITGALTSVVAQNAVIQAQLSASLPAPVLAAFNAVAAVVETILNNFGQKAAQKAGVTLLRVHYSTRQLARLEKARSAAVALTVQIALEQAKAGGK